MFPFVIKQEEIHSEVRHELVVERQAFTFL